MEVSIIWFGFKSRMTDVQTIRDETDIDKNRHLCIAFTKDKQPITGWVNLYAEEVELFVEA